MSNEDDTDEAEGDLVRRWDNGEPLASDEEQAIRPIAEIVRELPSLDPLPGWEDRARARALIRTIPSVTGEVPHDGHAPGERQAIAFYAADALALADRARPAIASILAKANPPTAPLFAVTPRAGGVAVHITLELDRSGVDRLIELADRIKTATGS